jgi:tetrahydromethanopterin S-methyltransferase subunit G|tara:strand:+ start:709 stop:849 length:141 start_codon:yes stop_codon:yes gene_type:complete
MKLEDINKRLEEIPVLLEQLKAEQNQLLGYKQALLDIAKEDKEKKE